MASQDDNSEGDVHQVAYELDHVKPTITFRAASTPPATSGSSSVRRLRPLSTPKTGAQSVADSEDGRNHILPHRPSHRITSGQRQTIEYPAPIPLGAASSIGTSTGSVHWHSSDPIVDASGSINHDGSPDIPVQPAARKELVDELDDRSLSIRTERTYLQRRDLDALDVAALIINKQIGTGIFTTPGLVLSLTGSKTISMILWFCGGIWAFLSVVIYVEFGSAFPFNGGELIYLDEVLRTPELLATVLFSAFFIFIPNTDGNSLQFARHVLLAANPAVTETTELDKRLVTYVAITVLTFVSFIHYFSRNSGLVLNLLFATYKVVLVTVLIVCGCIASRKPDNGWSDWGEQPIASKNVLGAMVYIIYSYQGWENANYVGGELKIESRALKWGAFLAILVTTLLYCFVVMAYSLACPFQELAGQDLGVVSNFAPKAFGRRGVEGIKVCIALSAFGNLIAVIYTSSKVKQQIARQCILPFYRFFSHDDKQFMTPAGALILHWCMAAIWIICTPNTSAGYAFIIGLFIYGQLVVGVFVGFAFFFIRESYEGTTTRSTNLSGGTSTWYPVILKNKYLRFFSGMTFIGMNLVVIVQSARGSGSPPPWLKPVLFGGLLLTASIYWLAIILIAKTSNPESPLEIRIERDGMPLHDDANASLLRKAKSEGNSRVVVYVVRGKLKEILSFVESITYRGFKLISR